MRDDKGRFLKGTVTKEKTSIEVLCKFCNDTFLVQPHRFKSGRGKYCSKNCMLKGMFTPELRKKMSEMRKGKPTGRTGEKCPFWKGGVTPINKKIRMSLEMRTWRETVFKRDDYTCQICKKKGGTLNADHIKPFALYPELHFELNNGRTLCIDCHKKTDTYAKNKKILSQRAT